MRARSRPSRSLISLRSSSNRRTRSSSSWFTRSSAATRAVSASASSCSEDKKLRTPSYVSRLIGPGSDCSGCLSQVSSDARGLGRLGGEERVHELARDERAKVVDRLSDADEVNRDTELVANGEHDA